MSNEAQRQIDEMMKQIAEKNAHRCSCPCHKVGQTAPHVVVCCVNSNQKF